MAYISLIDQLSDLDKQRIKNYLYTYGNKQIPNLDVKDWLCYWDHSNQNMYKVLGNSLIKEIPYKIEKKEDILKEEIKALRDSFYPYFDDLIYNVRASYDIENGYYTLGALLSTSNVLNNTVDIDKKLLLNNGKYFQIQRGMKLIKVIGKIFSLYKEKPLETSEGEKFLKEFTVAFEQFKKDHSILLNEKYINGTLCFSIHPMDFLTMSDNSFRWSSCMSWKENGCYRVGTIEMMNSNNVICAYLKSNDRPFVFGDDPTEKDESFAWNNKKWRQLFYVTKDIVVNGKSYPFAFDNEIQTDILTKLKDLILKNTNWHYTYGPEPYKDMIHIHSKYRMDNNRLWIQYNDTKKHNILFDTKGMYNDVLNDVSFNYVCFRNKVKSNKILSISGKANCICCNNTLLRKNTYEDNRDYNERYMESSQVLCDDCLSEIPICDSCQANTPTLDYIKLVDKNTGAFTYYCKECFQRNLKICPICGEVYDIENMDLLYSKVGIYTLLYGTDFKNNMTRTANHYTNDEILRNEYEKQNINCIKIINCCFDCMRELSHSRNENKLWKNIKIIPYRWTMTSKERMNIIEKKEYENRKILIDKIGELASPYKNAIANENNICLVHKLPREVRMDIRLINDLYRKA